MGEILADKELQKVTDAACAGYFLACAIGEIDKSKRRMSASIQEGA